MASAFNLYSNHSSQGRLLDYCCLASLFHSIRSDDVKTDSRLK